MKATDMITTIHPAGFGAYLGRNIREMDGDILFYALFTMIIRTTTANEVEQSPCKKTNIGKLSTSWWKFLQWIELAMARIFLALNLNNVR